MPVLILVLLLIVALIIVPATTGSFGLTVLALALVLLASPVVRLIRKNRYFTSEHFQALKAEIFWS